MKEILKGSPELDHLMKTKEIIESGYAGILPTGRIVDRRTHAEARAIPANPMFGCPKPKEVK